MKLLKRLCLAFSLVMAFAVSVQAEHYNNDVIESEDVWLKTDDGSLIDTSCDYVLETFDDECSRYIKDANSEAEVPGCPHRIKTLATPRELRNLRISP